MKSALLASLLFFALLVPSADPAEFPVPTGKENMLFYVQRTFNKNTLIYELNLTENNTVNVNEPVKIYWVNYATDGKEEPLNYIQRKYAYGLEHLMTDPVKQTFCLNFVSYKKQLLYLIKNERTHKYGIYTKVNKNTLRVTRIFVNIDGGSFWFPKVTHILLSGINTATGEAITEKIIPVRESWKIKILLSVKKLRPAHLWDSINCNEKVILVL